MATITFTVAKKYGCYVAKVIKDQNGNPAILAAIAKACINQPDMDGDITVTLKEEDVESVYSKLTIMPEGVAAKPNNALQDVLAPLLGDYPALAEKITIILTGNATTLDRLQNQGLDLVNDIAASISDN